MDLDTDSLKSLGLVSVLELILSVLNPIYPAEYKIPRDASTFYTSTATSVVCTTSHRGGSLPNS